MKRLVCDIDLEILSPRVQLHVRKDYHPHDARSKTVPIRHVLSSKFNEYVFIYLVLNKNEMHKSYYVH